MSAEDTSPRKSGGGPADLFASRAVSAKSSVDALESDTEEGVRSRGALSCSAAVCAWILSVCLPKDMCREQRMGMRWTFCAANFSSPGLWACCVCCVCANRKEQRHAPTQHAHARRHILLHERVATAKCKVAGRGQPTQGWTQHVSLTDGAAHA